MVLSYFLEKNKAPLILDNLSFRILNLNIREDIKADMFINANGIFKINKNNTLIKIANHSKQYTDLMKKIQRNN